MSSLFKILPENRTAVIGYSTDPNSRSGIDYYYSGEDFYAAYNPIPHPDSYAELNVSRVLVQLNSEDEDFDPMDNLYLIPAETLEKANEILAGIISGEFDYKAYDVDRFYSEFNGK